MSQIPFFTLAVDETAYWDSEFLAANRTNAGYFDAMQIRLVAGRIYSDSEVRSDAPVAVVSESVARRIWGTAPNALGASMARIDVNLANVTIIGVVQDDGRDVAQHVEALTPERANAIGAAARARILAEHTYERRGAQVDAILREEGALKRERNVA